MSARPPNTPAGPDRAVGVVACNLVVVLAALCTQASAEWVLVVLLWLNAALYAAADLGRRAILLAFLLSFFVLLLGREITIDFFRYESRWDPPGETRHLQACLVLSLVGLWAGSRAQERWGERIMAARAALPQEPRRALREVVEPEAVRVIFLLVLAVSLASVAMRAQFVLSHGYLAFYTEFSQVEGGSGPLFALRRIELMLPMVLGIHLGMFPPRREVRQVTAAWAVYLLLSLGTGQRGLFVGGVALIVAYWVLRHRMDPEGGWRLGTAGRVVGAVLVPVTAVGLTAVESARGVGAVAADPDSRNAVLQMFYGQGVSSSVIRNAYTYADFIPDTLYTAEFLRTGFVGRLLGFKVYYGNTVEHALEGGSFTHAFGYTLLGPAYLTGRGTGSSYIAELYFDFGYVGVLLGSAVLGALCVWSCTLVPGQAVRNGLRLVIVPSLLWSPRGSATGFLTTWLSPSVLITLGVVVTASTMVTVRRRRLEARRRRRADLDARPVGRLGAPRRTLPGSRRAPTG